MSGINQIFQQVMFDLISIFFRFSEIYPSKNNEYLKTQFCDLNEEFTSTNRHASWKISSYTVLAVLFTANRCHNELIYRDVEIWKRHLVSVVCVSTMLSVLVHLYLFGHSKNQKLNSNVQQYNKSQHNPRIYCSKRGQ